MFKTGLISRALRAAFAAFLMAAIFAGNVSAKVEIIRDATGMAHVYGANNAEVFYGFGYIVAKDRMFQLEMRKRQALGTTAEILGPGDKRWPDKFIVKDREARLFQNREDVKAEYENLPKGDKTIISAFTKGINRAMNETLTDGTLSDHFSKFDVMPETWTVYDTLTTAIDILGAYSAFSTQLVNLDLYRFLRGKYPNACDDIFDQLMWMGDPNALTSVGDHLVGALNSNRMEPQGCGNPPNQLRLEATSKSVKSLQHLVPPRLEPMRASMSWAVGADKADGFRSIFVNGPQPGWHSPGYFYPIGLHGGDFDLIGFAPEGTFVIEIGVNNAFSWGMTAGLSSQVDHYEERLGSSGRTYLSGSEWDPIEWRPITISVKGQDAVTENIGYTHHGPIVASDGARRVAYSRKISWQGRGATSVMAWVHAGKAQSFNDWLGHARAFDMNYNWFYADRDGYVGFAHTGLFPARVPGHDHRLPASGTGEFEWQGRLPAEDDPVLLTRGYYANFNNKPLRDWPNSGLFWEQWAAANQVDILTKALEAKDRLTWDDVWAVNRAISYTDVSARYFIPFILDAGKHFKPNSREAGAMRLLAEWNRMRTDDNHDGFFDHAGQTIFDAWLPIMVGKTLGPTLEGFDKAGIFLAAGYQTRNPRLEEHPSAGTLVLYYALENSRHPTGVPHFHSFFAGTTADEIVRQSLVEALDSLEQKFNGPMEGWRNKAVEQVFFDSNTNRIPMTSPGLTFRLPLYANRGAMNLMTGYPLNDGLPTAGYVNPPGPQGYLAPGQQANDNPLLTNHLDAYRDQVLLPGYLTRDAVEGSNPNGTVIELEFYEGTPKL